MRAFDTILMFTIGSILWQIPRSGSERERLVRLASLGPAEALNVIALGDEYARRDPDDYFVHGFEITLDGLEARLRTMKRRSR